MYHPTKVAKQYLNEVNYYQQIVDLLPVPGIEMVELPKLSWKEHEEWMEKQTKDRMIAALNHHKIQVWGTNNQHLKLETFLELIWGGSGVHLLRGDTRPEMDEMINDAMWCLIGYLNGEDIERYFSSK